MTTPTIHHFFERALHEAKRYGDDHWVFLREWVQNSRDAGASRIDIRAGVTGQSEWLECVDDGMGMTDHEIKRFLFRLYASSKEVDNESVGFYGVGFWSVLLFEPSWILVESRSGDCGSAYRIDCQALQVESVEPSLSSNGFRVVLHRERRFARILDLESEIRQRLDLYAGPVKPIPSQPQLSLRLNGMTINRELPRPRYLPTDIKRGQIHGSVGFGPKPWVRIYKAGILVRDLTDLHELIPSRGRRFIPSIHGLYPQIALNDDSLNVLMDRRSIYEDAHLKDMVIGCESELKRLEKKVVKTLFPINWINRWLRLWDRGKRHLWKGAAITAGLALISGLWLFDPTPTGPIGFTSANAAKPVTREADIDRVFDDWQEPQIDWLDGPNVIDWNVRLDQAEDLTLVVGHLTQFSPSAGLLPPANEHLPPYPDIKGGQRNIQVKIGLSGSKQQLVLPIPKDMALITDLLGAHSAEVESVLMTSEGLPLIHFSQPPFELIYWVRRDRAPDNRPLPDHLDAPNPWPVRVQSQLDRIQELPDLARRVSEIEKLVTDWVQYARDWRSYQRYQALDLDWAEKVLAVGKGDCDVMNGLCVLMLRSVGIPAYVSVGLQIHRGVAGSNLHAWTTYYIDGWHHLDVSSDHIRPVAGATITDPVRAQPTPSPQEIQPDRAWIATLLAIALLAATGTCFMLVRRRRHPVESDPLNLDAIQVLGEMMETQNDGENASDLAQYIPVMSLTDGRRVSLRQLQKYTQRWTPFIGAKDHPALDLLHRDMWVLDEQCPFVLKLEAHVAETMTLDNCQWLLQSDDPPPALDRVLQVLGRYRNDVDIRFHHGPMGNCEVRLKTSDGKVKTLVAMTAKSSWLRATADLEQSDVGGQVRAGAELLARTVALRPDRHRLMNAIVREIGGAV